MVALKRFLTPAYRAWMRFAHILGVINGTIILSVLFVALIGPIALVRHTTGFFLWLFGTPQGRKTRWRQKKERPITLDELSRFF